MKAAMMMSTSELAAMLFNVKDDSSFSSTLSVREPISSAKDVHHRNMMPQQSHCNNNSVRFDLDASQYIESNRTQSELKYLWYSLEEYDHFKRQVQFMARVITEAEGNTAFRQRIGYNSTYTGILESTYAACLPTDTILNEQGLACLTGLYSVEIGLGRLGLERRSVRILAREKALRRAQLTAVVTQETSEHDNRAIGYRTADEVAELLRAKCEAVSHPHRLFAQYTAEAQLSAIHE